MLMAPKRFFVEVDSVLSLIVHRFGYKLPDDILHECSRLYHESRSIYETGKTTETRLISKAEGK